jgi:hypothetical protein
MKRLQFPDKGHNDRVNNPIDGFTMRYMQYVNGGVVKEKTK